MVHKEGDTFWYHECKYTEKRVYLPIGMKCPDCVLENMSSQDKAKMQQQRYSEVIMDCCLVLELDEKNFKALFRRASAYEALEKYSLALEDIQNCALLYPYNSSVNNSKNRLQNAVRQLKKMRS